MKTLFAILLAFLLNSCFASDDPRLNGCVLGLGGITNHLSINTKEAFSDLPGKCRRMLLKAKKIEGLRVSDFVQGCGFAVGAGIRAYLGK